MTSITTQERGSALRMPAFGEFVALVAVMMGLTALSIDNLLPAFPPIRSDFSVSDPNSLQLLVYVYMIGFGATQLVYGPVADVVGRRGPLLTGIGVYAVGCLMAAFATSFEMLLAARVVQGAGVSAARVLAVAIVRDCYQGREMARVMSLSFAVFIIVPVIAPGMGSLVLLAGSWRLLFLIMLALAAAVAIWFAWRMPETLHPEHRRAFSVGSIWSGVKLTVSTRAAFGYSSAVGLMMGSLMGYVGSSQQIFETEVYELGRLFPLAFGSIAAAMGLAAIVNSRLVERLGMRAVSHSSVLGYLAVALVQVGVAVLYEGRPPLMLFGAILACNQFMASLTMQNFNALAMQPMGEVAGTASSFIGFYTTLLGALLGALVGQSFDGTVLPLGIGYAVLGGLCVLVVLWTERGSLFQHGQPAPQR